MDAVGCRITLLRAVLFIPAQLAGATVGVGLVKAVRVLTLPEALFIVLTAILFCSKMACQAASYGLSTLGQGTSQGSA